jgi:peptidoglycan/xylan/chitin deacetylase (PgdA/CDA1 family)
MSALWHGGFHPITMQQYVAYVHGHTQELPSRPILLTFDDGRRDAYFAATPILAQYGFHATEFDIPGCPTASRWGPGRPCRCSTAAC